MIKPSLIIKWTGALLGIGWISLAPAAHAALLASDGFDYDVGNVSGQNGGEGWRSAGMASSHPDYARVVTNTPLSYHSGPIRIKGSGAALASVLPAPQISTEGRRFFGITAFGALRGKAARRTIERQL